MSTHGSLDREQVESDRDAFHQIPRDPLLPAVVEPGGPWVCVASEVLHLVEWSSLI